MKLLTIDIEGTGVDALNEHIVSLFIGVMEDDGSFSEKHEFLFNPGVEIPDSAVKIHGITNERVKEIGIPVADHENVYSTIRQLISLLAGENEIPVVIYNAPYDTTLINTMFKRHGIKSINWDELVVIDPLVIDKAVDKWRKGSRTLTNAATHYGIVVDEEQTHSADYDCYLVGNIAHKLLSHPSIVNLPLKDLQMKQKGWKLEQATSLQAYLRNKNSDETIVVNTQWPTL